MSPSPSSSVQVQVHARNVGEFATAIYHAAGIAESISKSIDACVNEATEKRLPVIDHAAVERIGFCGAALQWWTQLSALQSRQLMKTSAH